MKEMSLPPNMYQCGRTLQARLNVSLTTTVSFPSLRSKPSSTTLLSILESLAIDSGTQASISTSTASSLEDLANVNQYLMSIISNDLSWLGDSPEAEEKKEKVWELASKRIAERCGRSGTFTTFLTWEWMIPIF
jgi:hypothetical protein